MSRYVKTRAESDAGGRKRRRRADREYRSVDFPSLVDELTRIEGMSTEVAESLAVAVFLFRPPPRPMPSAWSELSKHLGEFLVLLGRYNSSPEMERLIHHLLHAGDADVRRAHVLGEPCQLDGSAKVGADGRVTASFTADGAARLIGEPFMAPFGVPVAMNRRKLARPALDHLLTVGVEILEQHGLSRKANSRADGRPDALTVMATVVDLVWEFEPGARRQDALGREAHELSSRDVESIRAQWTRARRVRPSILPRANPLVIVQGLVGEARQRGTVRGQRLTWLPAVARGHRSS